MEVKQAVKAATEYLQALYPGIPHDSVRLEEVESTEDVWYITLSFLRQADNVFQGLATHGLTRNYKVFTIEVESGKVPDMKIRQMEGA